MTHVASILTRAMVTTSFLDCLPNGSWIKKNLCKFDEGSFSLHSSKNNHDLSRFCFSFYDLFYGFCGLIMKLSEVESVAKYDLNVISCHHSSSHGGLYNMTIGNITWKTRCRMKSIPGCGRGPWELIIRIKGRKVCRIFLLMLVK